MKKYIYLCLTLGMTLQNVYAASAEQYVLAVEEINAQYKQDTRQFLRGLNPQQQGFNPQQQQQFCGIVSRMLIVYIRQQMKTVPIWIVVIRILINRT